jgi:3-hydroxyethyl bacteriochlorophyllide a dehydrogenase
MLANAVVLERAKTLGVQAVELNDPTDGDVVIDIAYSGISAGTEKLFWSGEMPPFPGMGYPLIPGYEASGEVVDAAPGAAVKVGDTVFVPGATCTKDVKSLFGGASSRIVTSADRVIPLDAALGSQAALLALAATARHALAGVNTTLPDLIVGHGVLGRLLARLTVAAGGAAPTVWDTAADRRTGAVGYDVIDPDTDERRDYRCIYDCSGDSGLLNSLVARLAKGGEIVLAGFYPEPLSFAFPPAFMKEARFRIAAEWNKADMIATRELIDNGALSLDGLITHTSYADAASDAYATAFSDPGCLKMILDWRASA